MLEPSQNTHHPPSRAPGWSGSAAPESPTNRGGRVKKSTRFCSRSITDSLQSFKLISLRVNTAVSSSLLSAVIDSITQTKPSERASHNPSPGSSPILPRQRPPGDAARRLVASSRRMHRHGISIAQDARGGNRPKVGQGLL
jgi:hypothetical protein